MPALLARAVIALAVFAGLLTVLGSGLVTVDSFPAFHVYGVSVGTSTHYCSAELVNWHPPAVTCQAGQ